MVWHRFRNDWIGHRRFGRFHHQRWRRLGHELHHHGRFTHSHRPNNFSCTNVFRRLRLQNALLEKVLTNVQIYMTIFVAERYVTGQNIPSLQAVGWEGIFGLTGICLLMIPLNFIKAPKPFTDNARGTLEATVDAFVQIGNNGRLFMAIFGE